MQSSCIFKLAGAALVFHASVFGLDFTNIDFPGAVGTFPFGINAEGDIVGSYQLALFDVSHGFLFHKGGFTTVDFPGARSTTVSAINPQGDMAGSYFDSMETHGFVLRHGVFTTVEFPGADFTIVNGISVSGDIVGTNGDSPFGPFHGFVRRHGVFTAIDPPGSAHTEGWGINQEGDIVGFSRSPSSLLLSDFCSSMALSGQLARPARNRSASTPGATLWGYFPRVEFSSKGACSRRLIPLAPSELPLLELTLTAMWWVSTAWIRALLTGSWPRGF